MLLPLQQSVTHVVENYDGDDAVFDASNGKLETHLQEQVRKAELLERRHVEAARGKEKLEVAKLRATQTLDAIIGDKRQAKSVRALLTHASAHAATQPLLRQGHEIGRAMCWAREGDYGEIPGVAEPLQKKNIS